MKPWLPISITSKQQLSDVLFDNDTVAIHIFVKGLRDAPTIAAKIYKKDPKLWPKSSDCVEKLSVEHQLTATLTPSTWSV